ncbi:hypothetical protein CDAR_437591 [Caerostris darwini]|uniref:Uncharacterized protein n=1 Tax=Caerostris darwini TaxID=1538125 RepID=A0AAV4NVY8_9ARAC|nr:hypothetical protein CDAR_437591 [Caerostris darwini]
MDFQQHTEPTEIEAQTFQIGLREEEGERQKMLHRILLNIPPPPPSVPWFDTLSPGPVDDLRIRFEEGGTRRRLYDTTGFTQHNLKYFKYFSSGVNVNGRSMVNDREKNNEGSNDVGQHTTFT